MVKYQIFEFILYSSISIRNPKCISNDRKVTLLIFTFLSKRSGILESVAYVCEIIS